MDILYLFLHALAASTLIPISSEIGLAALVNQFPHNALLYFVVATIGNTIGSLISYGCGRFLTQFQNIERLSKRKNRWFLTLKKYGNWTLLLAWLPIIGDFLCIGAGVLKLNIWISTILILIGKAARYAIVIWIFI
ncbi:MAG: DedA family protein [Saccharospirillaceae bacterium]|nr:DedA family protein [Pseudomonadales bacterium]NRB77889.1 DedA family protein [Saccharospirillaceae bacterium]